MWSRSVESGDEIPVALWALLRDPELLFYVRTFAANEDILKVAFAEAWEALMTNDRFDGPTGNVCM